MTDDDDDDPVLAAAMQHIQAGAFDAAADTLRQAVAEGPERDEASRRRHLTRVMNLGDLLVYLRAFDEAEAVLRAGLQGRADLYGRTHPGYAYGLEPLAEALLRAGRARQALPVAEQAVAILWNHNHERTPELMTLRAFVRVAVDPEDEAFQDMEALPARLIQVAIDTALERAGRDLTHGPLVLRQLLAWMDAHGHGGDRRSAVCAALADA
ncbi:MAG: tetratricopeptide repeat protein [Myxococcota bacterium]